MKSGQLSFQIHSLRSVNEEQKDLNYYSGDVELDSSNVEISFNFLPEINRDIAQVIDIFTHVRYVYKQDDLKVSFLHFDIVSSFRINNFDDIIKRAKKGGYSISTDHLTILTSIAISNTRGYLAAKTEGILKGKMLLPVLAPSEIVSKQKTNIKKDRYYFDDFIGASIANLASNTHH